MIKYLYLTFPEWCDSWVNGGEIPLNSASFYRRSNRGGIYTPDENLIYEGSHDLRGMPIMGRDISLNNVCFLNEEGHYAEVRGAGYIARHELDDGVILSLCNRKSNEIARRLNKSAGVRINNVNYLKSVIDEQLGNSVAKSCEYTSHHNRNHFLKSIEDSWQDEFRLFWNCQGPVRVELPKGIAKRIKIRG